MTQTPTSMRAAVLDGPGPPEALRWMRGGGGLFTSPSDANRWSIFRESGRGRFLAKADMTDMSSSCSACRCAARSG
jgi:hypothetical protein